MSIYYPPGISAIPHNTPGTLLADFTNEEIKVQRGLTGESKAAHLRLRLPGVTLRFHRFPRVSTATLPDPTLRVRRAGQESRLVLAGVSS